VLTPWSKRRIRTSRERLGGQANQFHLDPGVLRFASAQADALAATDQRLDALDSCPVVERIQAGANPDSSTRP